jgi:uncharacterized protein (UPF0333 family)
MRRKIICRKSQVSMEFVLISTISMILLIPVMFMFFNYTSSTSRDIILAQAHKAARAMVDVSEQVWSYGRGGIQTVEVTFPKNIINLSIELNTTLVMETTMRGDVVAIRSRAPIYGNFTEDDSNPGTKKFRMENIGGEYVLIERIKR